MHDLKILTLCLKFEILIMELAVTFINFIFNDEEYEMSLFVYSEARLTHGPFAGLIPLI
jgi:hypothetical protein